MAILFSYPASAPALDDLLIGTDTGVDNATKTYTVQSLVALINAEAGSGTVTDVTISTDVFLSATKTSQPGVPAITYTLELVDNGTTPSATNFYRGDGKWVVPTVSSGISVFNQSLLVSPSVAGGSDYLSSINFTGNGVTTTSDTSGNVSVSIPGAINDVVTSLTQGTGIGLSGTTGDIIVSNTGVTSILPGNNITLTGLGTGVVEINAAASATGIASVVSGTGISVADGVTNPVVSIDYTGIDNFISAGLSAATALPADQILFNQASTNNIKSTTFGDIQATTLESVDTLITSNNARNITNANDDGSSVARVNDVITMTQGTYDALVAAGTTVANTLYLTKAGAAVTQYTKQHNITDGIAGSNYTLTSTVPNGTSRTRSDGTVETWTTSVSPASGYSFNGTLSITPPSHTVTYTNNNAVSTSVSGTSTLIPVSNGTVTLLFDTNGFNDNDGAVLGTTYTIVPAAGTTQNGAPGSSWTAAGFGVAVALKSPNTSAEWNLAPTISFSQTSGNYTGGNQNITCTITGSISKQSYTRSYTISPTANPPSGSTYSFSNNVSGTASYVDAGNTGGTFSGKYGTIFGVTTSISNIGSNSTTISALPTGAASFTSTSWTMPTATITDSSAFTVAPTPATGSTTSTVTIGSLVNSIDNTAGGADSVLLQYSIDSGNTYITTSSGASIANIANSTNFQLRLTIAASSGFYSTPPSFSYGGSTYTGGSSGLTQIFGAFQVTTSVTTNAVNISGSTSSARTSFPRSGFYSSQSGACATANRPNDGYLVKSGSNTSSYPEQNDIVYTTRTGSTLLANGFYSSTISNGTTNAYIKIASGVVIIADPCT